MISLIWKHLEFFLIIYKNGLKQHKSTAMWKCLDLSEHLWPQIAVPILYILSAVKNMPKNKQTNNTEHSNS